MFLVCFSDFRTALLSRNSHLWRRLAGLCHRHGSADFRQAGGAGGPKSLSERAGRKAWQKRRAEEGRRKYLARLKKLFFWISSFIIHSICSFSPKCVQR